MSGGRICRCAESYEPLEGTRHRPGRLWRVVQRNANQSAFNGYQVAWSRFSEIWCLRCGACWRTKASYVLQLKDVRRSERNLSPGINPEHGRWLLSQGRTEL